MRETLRYGLVSRTATYWNFAVADDRDLYRSAGLSVDPVLTGSTSATIDLLASEGIELAGCSPDELISAVQRGADLVVIGGIINRPVSRIVGRPDVAEIQALRGKRVAANQTRGSVSMVLRAVLRGAGLGDGDYQLVTPGATPEMAAALAAGEADAAMLTAPFDLELAARGFTILADVGEYFPNYAFTTINARRAWVEHHPAIVEAFFQATVRAGDLIASGSEREGSLGALERWTGLVGDALQGTYEIYQQPGVLSRRGEMDPAGLEAVLDLMAVEGLVAGPRPRLERLLLPRWSNGSF